MTSDTSGHAASCHKGTQAMGTIYSVVAFIFAVAIAVFAFICYI